MAEKLILNENRFFNSDPTIRKIARELYEAIKDLPLVCPHGHVDPKFFAENRPFPNPTELIIIPDHYIYRMLYSQGISLESLGIPTINNEAVDVDHRKIWQIFCDNYYLFAGTPVGVWLDYELAKLFDINVKLTTDTAMSIYDQIQEKLQSPEFLPRALFDRFNIEVLTTTDGAIDTLKYHQQIQDSDWNSSIIPCFRPDSVIDITSNDWQANINILSELCGFEINSYQAFIKAIENRRSYFKNMGAVSTDQGVFSPYTHKLTAQEADVIFQKALQEKASVDDGALFNANMLIEMARMSIDDELVMQIHPGCYRNHNQLIFDKFGPDKGCDIPVQIEYTHNLRELLNTYGNDPHLKLIVFTLDETTYSRELAPLAGHYPSLKLGPAWWFNDSIEGMTRFRQRVTETAGIYNTVGFNDDTRAFPSIPARHDLARRIDSNFLAGLVARHVISMTDAYKLSKALAYDLVKENYNL